MVGTSGKADLRVISVLRVKKPVGIKKELPGALTGSLRPMRSGLIPEIS